MESNTETDRLETNTITFDPEKWEYKEGKNYPYRDQMLSDIVYNDTIRSLTKDELTTLLGPPDRVNENYIYYTIDRDGVFIFTLHQKSMVVKFSADSIEWIKIHE